MASTPIREKRRQTQRSHVKIEAENGAMQPKAKQCLEPPEAQKSMKDPSQEPLERAWLC